MTRTIRCSPNHVYRRHNQATYCGRLILAVVAHITRSTPCLLTVVVWISNGNGLPRNSPLDSKTVSRAGVEAQILTLKSDALDIGVVEAD